MAPTYLEDIVAHHRARALRDTRRWQDRMGEVRYEGPTMLESLQRADGSNVKVIAEVKRRSPSKGWINEDLDPAALALEYQRGGASAISVLTDEEFFGGSTDDLVAVHQTVSLPLLRKDFTVSANDVLDAAAMGASTVLLIVAALGDEELELFLRVAGESGLDALVEVHDVDEARRAVDAGSRIIGVNQRDLRSFEVSADRASVVISSLPSSVVTVAESGLTSVGDVERCAAVGFDAVLVGENFVRSAAPAQDVRSFASVARAPRD